MGPAKDNLSVDEVCRQFGSFARLKCEKIEADSVSTSSDVDDPVQPNAFQVLFMNQRALSSKSTYTARSFRANNKDKLFNDLVLLFEKKDWKWRDGGDTHGKKFRSNLCDVLRYIDGHHETLEARSCAIPTPFNTFTGYNTPEKSKHRKRQAECGCPAEAC